MQTLHDLAQMILQILSSPALGGIGSICTLLGLPLAVYLARRPKDRQMQAPQHSPSNDLKVVAGEVDGKTRWFLRDGYHRAALAQELVKDLDIISTVNLNHHLHYGNREAR